uniref:Type IX secretion system membrane protein PorP/SprF n=1 Tax=Prevotella sp. GTC17254 TaxID=3236794 RepID=A0AB33J2M5_9BACT
MAQYDVSFSHYFDMEPSFNPAAVGKQSKLNITAAYALDMVGYENNPRTLYAAADIPFYWARSYHGAGVQFMSDQLGLFTHQRLAVQYAYRRKLAGGNLGVGVQAGMLSEKFEGSKLDVEDPNDSVFAKTDVNGNGLDLGVGAYYDHGTWYAGISVLHLNAATVRLGTTNELKIDPTFYLTAGYNIQFRNPFLTMKLSGLMRTDGTAYRGDITSRLVYTNQERMMYGGLSYNPTNSVTFLLGGTFHGFVVGYSYELYTSAIQPGNGSHELFVGYQMDINLVKKGKNKHQSVRIL